MTTLLEIENLSVVYRGKSSWAPALRNINFSIEKGETLGIVGESGCGKSTLGLALMGLLPEKESKVTGKINFEGINLMSLAPHEWLSFRGRKISMIFQDPFSSLNPVISIRSQLEEAIKLDGEKPTDSKLKSLLSEVQLPDPERILNSYPHQLSGGQRQRVMIAIALSRRPDLLIADEPTTALDVTIQSEIMHLLQDLQRNKQMALLFITHNMGLIKQMAGRIGVMYAGQVVELGRTTDVLQDPLHPYTQGLIRCLPRMDTSRAPLPVLEGSPPNPHEIPSGCAFHPRCEKIFNPCTDQDPKTVNVRSVRVHCHLYHDA